MGATCAKMPSEGEHFTRIMLLGECSTGKTSLARSYFTRKGLATPREETFAPNHFECKTIEVDNTLVDIELLDMTGDSTYEGIADVWFTQCNAVLLVYDVTRPKTFDTLATIMKKLRCVYGDELKHIPIAVAANKVDLFDKTAGRTPSLYCDYRIYETSAKDDHGVTEVFSDLLRLSMKKF